MNERLQWIDMAKGWGILLLIYGHIADDIFAKWLYTFHIPLFFFLSGYVFNPNKDWKTFIYSKSKSLLLPYISLGIPLILINLHYGFDFEFLITKFIVQERMFPLWFITSLFIMLLIAYCLFNRFRNKTHQLIISVLLGITGVTLWRMGIVSLPWNIDITMVAFPFFYIGYRLKNSYKLQAIFRHDMFVFWLSFFIVSNLAGFALMQLSNHTTIDLFNSKFGIEYIAYPCALAGIFAISLFSNSFTVDFISYIGRNSLLYFAWQQDIAIVISSIIIKHTLLDNFIQELPWIMNLITLLLSVLILTILNVIVTKSCLKVFIGK